ncbi:MAG: SMI1/KNR4 family protein [Polyangiaceae bacterium]|nr:SMI1/KNR4 family protein [Polyangiaceae bacterium]
MAAQKANANIERGTELVQKVIAHLKKRASGAHVVGASQSALDALESKLMVELPPTLRTFLAYDFTFESLGKKFKGKHRFGTDPRVPRPRMTSVRKLAEAMVELGWTDSRIKGKVIRIPNVSTQPWNALYLGEARRDGELLILGLDAEDTNVRVFPRYTAFDLYIAEQAGLYHFTETQRTDDLESHIALNPELGSSEEEEEIDQDY